MTAQTNPTTSSKQIHETLRQINYNLVAVGVGKREHKKNAFIASWITQVSFKPTLLAIAVRKDSESRNTIERDAAFSINLLSKEQTAIARQLVKPADRVGDKLAGLESGYNSSGTPILANGIAHLDCKLKSILETGGDHTVFIAEVVDGRQRSDQDPLTTKDLGWTYAG